MTIFMMTLMMTLSVQQNFTAPPGNVTTPGSGIQHLPSVLLMLFVVFNCFMRFLKN